MESATHRSRTLKAVAKLSLILGTVLVFSLVLSSSAHTKNGHYVGTGRYILATARSYIGTPYGHGPYKMVCSELTRAAVGPNTGVWLPANVYAQDAYGWHPKKMKKGDLVFLEYGGHTGIYAGNGEIVHASNYFMEVVESDMKYIHGFTTYRRVR